MKQKKSCSRLISLMLVICVFLMSMPTVLAAFGDTGTDGDFAWEELADGTVKVTAYTGAGGNIVIPDTLSGRVVSEIGNALFKNNFSLTGITIPSSVTTIGDEAFYRCFSLPNITFPNGLTSIGTSAFWGCSSLTGIVIPNSVTTIGNDAFNNCWSMTSITLSTGLTSIGASAFANCLALTGITIPDGVTSISNNMFERCKALASVTLPSGLLTIGQSAFLKCEALTSITIPDGVTSIGVSAFEDCYALTAGITIPDGVTSISDSAFQNCKALTSVTLPSGLLAIGQTAFSLCTSLTSITIPDGVTSIGNGAFSGCNNLTSVILPDSITSIDSTAFAFCSKLDTVTIYSPHATFGTLVFLFSPLSDGIYGLNGSTAQTYAAANGHTFHVLYTVTFDSQGGSTVPNQYRLTGETVDAPTDPTRDGYVLDGWYPTAACDTTAVTFPYTVTDDVTLYANWLPIYTVTFDSQGGSAVSDSTGLSGDTIGAPIDPTRDGYVFDGWYPTAACDTTAVTFPYTITGDVTLYAKWLPIYTVTFDSQGGSAVSDATGLSGDTIDAPTVPTWDGYVFDGWYPTAACDTIAVTFPYIITGNVTLYAKWLPIYTVTFDSQGGSIVSEATGLSGDTIGAPIDPTRDGYVFDGWYPTAACETTSVTFPYTITGNVTLYAKWLPIYTVTFDSQGGSAVSEATGLSGDTIGAPIDPTRDGYVFDGWYPTAACDTTVVTFPFIIIGDITLYAKWLPIYTVTFDSQGGSAVADKTAEESSDIDGPIAPTRDGYVFGGWYPTAACDGTRITFPYTVTGDVTLYAKWIPIYTVTFDSQGGSAVSDDSVLSGDTIDAPADPTRYGYEFDGWYPTAACDTTAVTFPYTVTDDVTLYAKWLKICTVTFNTQGGSEVADKTQTEGGSIDAPTNPTRYGYSFDGWYLTSACDGAEVTFPYTITDDLTLFAKWVKNNYTVTFDSQGGSSVGALTAAYREKVNAPTDPTRDGYVFDGWYPTAVCDGTETAFPYTVTQDVTLYAKWLPIYTVTFDSQGGSAVAAKTVASGSDISAPANPAKENHTFGGWYKTSACDGTAVDFPFVVTEDITLYANWTKQIDNPQTGASDTDNSLWVWVSVIIGAFLVITGLVFFKRFRRIA